MKPFLSQVASRYYREGLDGLFFIFPSRRAEVFFRKYLAQEVKGSARPVQSPPCATVDDFLWKAAGARKADRVRLLLILYECYAKLFRSRNGREPEPLDEFIFWGDVILADFGDADRYRVDAGRLFANIAEYRRMADSYEYLSENQREAIAHFVESFERDGAMKQRFLQVWDLLGPLYEAFRARLSAEGISYGGMAYRALAERLKDEAAADVFGAAFPGCRKFVFVGLNALDECEKTVLRALEKAGLAEFCWDFSGPLVRDPGGKASLFIAENLRDFPQAFHPDPEGLPAPEVHVLSVASGVGQAKLLPAVLRTLPPAERSERTAVVLPDEDLLPAVLGSIPAEFSELNVSMGLPMKGSALFALMGEIAAMQLHLREKDGWLFYHRQVRSIFTNSLFRLAAAGAEEQMDAVRKAAKYYIPQEELSGAPAFDAVFRPVVRDARAADADQVAAIQRYQLEVVLALAEAMKDAPDMALELEFARRYHQTVSALMQYRLAVQPATWFRLLDQMLLGESVPFRGEPLKGMQILGPLETRAVDFDNLVILSCNEGVYPRHPVASSFVPAELRRGYGLPTFEYHDAMNAYYFYRLLQRAKTVWLVCDSRMKNLRAGEESRYIKQLAYLYPEVRLIRHYAASELRTPAADGAIPKTPEDIDAIRARGISASAVKDYFACPARFCFRVARGLREEDEVLESLDAKAIGNVLHRSLEDIYRPPTVRREDLQARLDDPEGLRALVAREIMEEMKTRYVEGRDTVHLDLVLAYVTKILERDIRYLDAHGAPAFEILGLEKKYRGGLDGFLLKGTVDRMDRLPGGPVRIVDYKTGAVSEEDTGISDANAGDVLKNLFGKGSQDRPTIALQMYFYDMLVRENDGIPLAGLSNSVYALSRLFVGDVADEPVSEAFLEGVRKGLSALLAEIADLSVPFERKGNVRTDCKYCDFKKLCKR